VYMTSTNNIIKTICSGCDRPAILDLVAEEVRVKYAGNGIQGRKHIPGGVGVADLWVNDNDLICWDCPVCENADSYEAD
jgi:hypothetical protein